MIITSYDELGLQNLLAQYEPPSAGSFREEVENAKIWFLSHNFKANEGGATNTLEAQSRNMMNICTKFRFDILIISGSYGGHRRHTMYDGQRHGYGISSPQVS